MFKEDWDCNPGSLGAYLMDVRVTIGAETGYLYHASWNVQIDNYAKLLTDYEWEGCTGNPEINSETKGDMIEWVLAFSSWGPYYPRMYDKWDMHLTFRVMKHISQEAKRIYFLRCNLAIILRTSGGLTDDEDEIETIAP